GATEAANASASSLGSPISALAAFINEVSTLLGGPTASVGGSPFSLSGNSANFVSFETGNWASAMSDVIGLAGGGLLPAATSDVGVAAAGEAVGAAAGAADLAGVTGPAEAIGMPVVGLGQATMVGALSAPPSWAGTVTPVASSGAATLGATFTS